MAFVGLKHGVCSLKHGVCSLKHGVCSFLNSESLAKCGLKGCLKAFKSFLKE